MAAPLLKPPPVGRGTLECGQLHPSEILAPIGAVAMGADYLATGARLNRRVAIKVLPGSFVSDPGRHARFPREAHLLGSLNPRNGLCLAAHFDRALDHGLIAFDDDLRFLLHPSLKRHPLNPAIAAEFLSRERAPLRSPERFLPDPALLAQHRKNKFKRLWTCSAAPFRTSPIAHSITYSNACAAPSSRSAAVRRPQRASPFTPRLPARQQQVRQHEHRPAAGIPPDSQPLDRVPRPPHPTSRGGASRFTLCPSSSSATAKSYLVCKFIHISADVPNYRANRLPLPLISSSPAGSPRSQHPAYPHPPTGNRPGIDC